MESSVIADRQDGNKRLLLAPQQWLDDLRVPQDAYDLLYRLGQKTVQFDRMKVNCRGQH